MKKIRFGCPIESFPGFEADAIVGDTVYQVLLESRDARRLRAAFMEMARAASSDAVRRAVLVMEEPAITETRLREEWQGASAVIRPELLRRTEPVRRCRACCPHAAGSTVSCSPKMRYLPALTRSAGESKFCGLTLYAEGST